MKIKVVAIHDFTMKYPTGHEWKPTIGKSYDAVLHANRIGNDYYNLFQEDFEVAQGIGIS